MIVVSDPSIGWSTEKTVFSLPEVDCFATSQVTKGAATPRLRLAPQAIFG